MRIGPADDTMGSMVILHGASLAFERIDVPDGEPAPSRRRPEYDTLLRVVEGTVRLEVDGETHLLTIENEARIAAGAEHRLSNDGPAARVLYELRRAVPSDASNRRSPSRTSPSRTESPGVTRAQPSTAATSR
jgi:glyoxylate utilization-related uncharacterized protein